MKIDKVNDEFIVDCTNNTTEERQQVYKFLVDNRGYHEVYLKNDYPLIVCNKEPGHSNWDTLEQYYNWVDSKKDLPVYSFEKFKEMYLEEQFILPARWCVRQNKQEINDWANQNRQTESNYIGLSGVNLFHFPKVNDFHLYSEVQPGYTLLTFEQFKKHILKQTEMEKEIIGYELKKDCEIYLEALDKISACFSSQKDRPYNVGSIGSGYYNSFKKAGVLELWFEPVYKEEFQVGDYVITKGYSYIYDGRILKISKITSTNCCYFDIIDGGSYRENHNFSKNSILRKATPEEIEKASKTVVKMHSSNKGEFEIEVVNKKAYYRPENKELTREFIEEILDWFDDSGLHSSQSSKKFLYTLKVDTLKVGCMEGTRKSDWQKVYDLIK